MNTENKDSSITQAASDEKLKLVTERLREGVAAMRNGDRARALQIFESVYKSDDLPKPVTGLSYYGLCLSSVRQQHRAAIALCEKAIEEKPNDPVHYANLIETYDSAGRRKKAFDTMETTLEKFPRSKLLVDLKERMGKRKRPIIPFLPRGNVINVVLGHMRHTMLSRKSSPGRK